MADSYGKYLESGYYKSTNIPTLQEQLSQYAVDDASLRSQAEALYKPTYDATKLSYEGQKGELLAGQEAQLRQINSSYDKGINTLNNSLTKRGLGRSSLVSTQGVAMENQRAQAIGDKTSEYLAQQRSIDSQIQQLGASYAQQIEARIQELRTQNQTAATQLQLQIAELQHNGYLAYMAAQKAKSSGGGGSSRSSGSSGGTNPPPPDNDVDDYEIKKAPYVPGGMGSSASSDSAKRAAAAEAARKAAAEKASKAVEAARKVAAEAARKVAAEKAYKERRGF